MKTLITSLFLIFSISLAYAGFQFKYKDGTTLTWSAYTEENDSYCTWKSIGHPLKGPLSREKRSVSENLKKYFPFKFPHVSA